MPLTTNDDSRLDLEQALSSQGAGCSGLEVDEPTQQVVLFRLAGQRFALAGSVVSEILSGEQSVYFIPGLPDTIEGVIHLRGTIESVITLERLLGLEASRSDGMILLVRGDAITTGVRIEQLDDVCDVVISALRPPPETLPEALKPFVGAVIHRDEREAIALLDAQALLSAFQAGQG
ncbi:chemotaxis protein CheW [Halomonas sp. PAMB 3232]|uniref:chemotaxis protein CheW n=1 Tax=Halomonas sp. PAMB 3232 TaxID=3075221 RepID=UPI003908375F